MMILSIYKEYEKYVLIDFGSLNQNIRNIVKTEIFKWQYFCRNYPLRIPKYINMAFCSDNIEVVKFGRKNGANKFWRCLNSNNIDVIKYAFSKKDFGHEISFACGIMETSNLEIAKYIIDKKLMKFDKCLYTNNVEVLKLITQYEPIKSYLKTGEMFECCLSSSSLEVVHYVSELGKEAFSKNKSVFEKCLESKNIEVIKYGIKMLGEDARKYVKYFNSHLGSSNLELVKLAVKMGATNFQNCFRSNNIEVVYFGLEMIGSLPENQNIFNECMYSDSLEVIKFGIEMKADVRYLNDRLKNNPETVNFLFKNKLSSPESYINSKNIDIILLVLKYGT